MKISERPVRGAVPCATVDEMEAWPELLSVRQAAAVLAMPVRSVYNLCARGELPAVKLGSTWRVNRRRLMALAGLTDGE